MKQQVQEDNLTEKDVIDAVQEYGQDLTVIMIAQRLSK